MTDFTYIDNGMFIRICPESSAAAEVWNEEIAPNTGGSGAVLATEFEVVKSQLRKAGYTIRKAVKSNQSDADLLSELGL